MAETHVFENREINKTRRTHAVAIRIRAAIADQVKSELAFGRFNAAVRFAYRRAKRADLHFRIKDRTGLNLSERLFQNFDAFTHFERAHHQAIVGVAMFAQRNAELETRIKSVAIHFANVIVHAAGAQHWAGNPGADREIGRKSAHVLRARDHDFVSKDQFTKLIEKFRKTIDNLLRGGKPLIAGINAATPEPHVVAHHPCAGKRFE